MSRRHFEVDQLYMFILMSKRDSCRYIQLDLGQLQVTNEVSWYGSPENDSSAVRIDVIHTKVRM